MMDLRRIFQKTNLFFLYCLLGLLESLFFAVQLVLIPADPQNSVLFGLSPVRLATLVAFLLALAVFLVLAVAGRRKESGLNQHVTKLSRQSVVFGIIFIISISFLFISYSILDRRIAWVPDHQAFLDRMYPVMYFLALLSLQTLLFLVANLCVNTTACQSYWFYTGVVAFFLLLAALFLPVRLVGYFLFIRHPEIGYPLLLALAVFLGFSLLPWRKFMNLHAAFFLIIVVLLIFSNIILFPALNRLTYPKIRLHASDSLIDLTLNSETSLNYPVYILFSEHYAGDILEVDTCDLERFSLSEADLIRFGHLARVEKREECLPKLEKTQIDTLLQQERITLRENAVWSPPGDRPYIFILSQSQETKEVCLRRGVDQNFVYPCQLLPDQGGGP